ncbi:MAG: hypothetical protein JXO51_04255, partial [Candidatus Aminicenantes bacterium]|nr:hypothetical protein [Candidatus Aminicenantes bacterium]
KQFDERVGLKHQITSTKSQTNTKHQLPNVQNEEKTLEMAFVWDTTSPPGDWDLELGIYLEFGIWCLELDFLQVTRYASRHAFHPLSRLLVCHSWVIMAIQSEVLPNDQ